MSVRKRGDEPDSSRQLPSNSTPDIRPREILAHGEQTAIVFFRDLIGEAVTEVQRGGMKSLSPSLSSTLAILGGGVRSTLSTGRAKFSGFAGGRLVMRGRSRERA